MSHLKNKGCVLNCEEFIASDNGFVEVDFYDFPSDPEIRGIWIDRVRKEKKTKSWYPNKKAKLCGMHFNNSGKNINNEVLPRFFGERIYTPVRIIEPEIEIIENVKIKEEIDEDDDPMSEENCIADYSNIYNTVPSKNDSVVNESFDPTTFGLTKIKEENLDFESEENPFSENDIYEPQVQIEVTENAASLNGYTFEKDYVNHQKEDLANNDSSRIPSCQWKPNGPFNRKKPMPPKNVHTHNEDCSRDLEQLKNQMKELEENLLAAHRKIEEGQILVVSLSNKEKESNKVKQELEEENRKLKSVLASNMPKYVLERKPKDLNDISKDSSKDSPKDNPQDMSYLDLKEETIRLEMQLARTREKMKRLHEQWYRKFESFGSDEEVQFYTGFKTGAEFKKFCNLAIEMDPALEPSSEENFNIRKQIMITLMRLRHGLQLQDLAFRYNISLDDVLQFVSHWQDILSKSFFNRKICQSGVIIVKFFVVELCNKIKLKYFLGVSPFGYVIYVSDLHPHLTNEKEIIVSSEILSLIEEGFNVKSLDTDRFSDLGISLWSVSHEEGLEFRSYISNLLKKVIRNGIFKNIHPSTPSWTQDVRSMLMKRSVPTGEQ